MNTNEASSKSPGTLARIKNDFASHKVDPVTFARMDAVRDKLRESAEMLVELMPGGRELSTALTKLEEAMFWANAGLARPHLGNVSGEGAP